MEHAREAQGRLWNEIIQKATLIPVGHEDFFRRLWREGRLRYNGKRFGAGTIEEISARMIATAVKRRASMFLVLPFTKRECAPALFASTLLIDAIDKMADLTSRSSRVLLFGSHLSIRGQLANTTVGEINLSAVFRQVHLEHDTKRARRQVSADSLLSDRLPQVVCALSPAKPRDVLDRFQPSWIAIDCDSDELTWLPSVLDLAAARGIPVVGWIPGYPTGLVGNLTGRKYPVFAWPPMNARAIASEITGKLVVAACARASFGALVVSGDQSDSQAEYLAVARANLAALARDARGQLLTDSVRAGWRCVRAIEGLHIPYKFDEVECKQFWGVPSLVARVSAFEKFAAAAGVTHQHLQRAFHDALDSIHKALEAIDPLSPPIWNSLLSICVGDASPTHLRRVVFASEARRKLFELALLAIEGISTYDLRTLGITLSTLGDLTCMSNETADSEASVTVAQSFECTYLVGLPAQERWRLLQPLFGERQVKILCLPHQEVNVRGDLIRLTEYCAVQPDRNTEAMRRLGIICSAQMAAPLHPSITSEPTEYVDSRGSMRGTSEPRRRLSWVALNPVAEAEWLLRGDDEEDADNQVSLSLDESEGDSGAVHNAHTSQELTIDRVVRVETKDHRTVLLAPDSEINVIRGGAGYESMREMRADSIRSGDRIAFIHGQKRQSLYDLLIARVHTHPSIQLHLALLRAWHDDLRRGYREWSLQHRKGFDELLTELQAMGCERSSPLTVRFWVTGEILCPSDAEDLRRLSVILSMPFVRDHYVRIVKAAERLRGLHRGLANRLSNWIRAQAAGSTLLRDDDVFDEELGLTLVDFRESVELLIVDSASEIQGLFLRDSLNRIDG